MGRLRVAAGGAAHRRRSGLAASAGRTACGQHFSYRSCEYCRVGIDKQSRCTARAGPGQPPSLTSATSSESAPAPPAPQMSSCRVGPAAPPGAADRGPAIGDSLDASAAAMRPSPTRATKTTGLGVLRAICVEGELFCKWYLWCFSGCITFLMSIKVSGASGRSRKAIFLSLWRPRSPLRGCRIPYPLSQAYLLDEVVLHVLACVAAVLSRVAWCQCTHMLRHTVVLWRAPLH